jgi:flavodoxin
MSPKNLLPGLAALFLAVCLPALQAHAQGPDGGALAQNKPQEYRGAPDAFGKSLFIVFSLTGNTLKLARAIQAKTGGDVFEVKLKTQYPAGDDLIPFAKAERDQKRPVEFLTQIPDLSPYDTVFFGTPVWFHDLPYPIAALLKETNFQGKRVLPFATSGGGPGDIARSLQESILNGKAEAPLLVSRYSARPAEEIQNEINSWLNPLAAAKGAEGSAGAP